MNITDATGYRATQPKKPSLAPPGLVLMNACWLFWHFLGGALWGFGLQLDPEPDWQPRKALGLAGAIALAAMLAEGAVQVGLALVIFSPIWLYMFLEIPDPVMETRAYLTVPGLAFLGAYAFSELPVLTALLIAALGVHTIERNEHWRNGEVFWQRATVECPKKLRGWVNYAVNLTKTPEGIERAINVYERVCSIEDIHTRQQGTAAANLVVLLIHRHNNTKEEKFLKRACEILAIFLAKYPDHPRLHYNQGCVLMGYERWEEAIEYFNTTAKLQPNFAECYLNRAKCHGRLGNVEMVEKDLAKKESLDGIPGKLNFVDPEKEKAYAEAGGVMAVDDGDRRDSPAKGQGSAVGG